MTKTRRSLSLVAAAALLLGLAAPAMAQSSGDDAPAPKPAKAAKAAKPEKVKKLIFTEGDTIESDVPSGQIIPVDARGFDKNPTLIRYRYSFVDKIMQSAESI